LVDAVPAIEEGCGIPNPTRLAVINPGAWRAGSKGTRLALLLWLHCNSKDAFALRTAANTGSRGVPNAPLVGLVFDLVHHLFNSRAAAAAAAMEMSVDAMDRPLSDAVDAMCLRLGVQK